MMELLKKHIHMNRRRGNVTSQMTLDDDFNVPDSMDDVEELIMENGEVKIESVKNPGEKAEISGKLEFRILYRRPGGELTALAGSIPFTETVHMPGLAENDYVQAGWELDDLNVSLINSRKLNVKALVTLELKADEIRDMETASDVKFDGEVEVLKKTLTVAAIAVRRRDTFRVREVLTIPGNDPDAETLLWQDMRLQDVETKPLDGKIHISGDLLVFAVYSAGGGQMPVQCFEETVPFSGNVELTESAEDMIPFITVKLVHRDMELQPDSDGEMREISVDAVMELDIRLYEEEQVELLGDLYALDREAVPETGTVCFDTLAVRNQVKTKIQEKVQLTGRQRILQPRTTIAPSLILRDLSGIIRSSSNSILYPRPKQSGQAPNGLLKEKLRGSTSSMLIPQSGQEKLWLKLIGSPPVTSTIIRPSDSFITVSMESVRRFSIPGFTTRRSTTISILCLIFFSSVISSDSSWRFPSIITRT